MATKVVSQSSVSRSMSRFRNCSTTTWFQPSGPPALVLMASLPVCAVVVFSGLFVESSGGAKRLRVWVLEPKVLPALVEK